jgi:hypothetical protein
VTADPRRVARIRRALAELGVTAAEFDAATAARMPTVAAYLPRVEAAAGPGARRTYGSYWKRLAAAVGSKRLDEVLATDIEALKHDAAARAVPRRTERGGRHLQAVATALAALTGQPHPLATNLETLGIRG